MVQWVCLISWRLFYVWTLYFGIMIPCDHTFDLKINLGCCDLHFMVQWFCLIFWRLFDVWTSYFGIIYDLTIDLKINVGHCGLYFMVQLFCLVSWRLLEWSSNFALYLEDWCMNITLRDYESVQLMFYLKINVGNYDLYFMFQWCCLISWRLFDVWTSYFGIELIWSKIWPQNKCRSLWPIFHGPMSLPYILKTNWCMNIVLWDYDSVWPYVWPQNKSRLLWPTFHGPVILPYILKTVWCMNILLWDYIWPDNWLQNKCTSLWPIFYGPVILPCILKTVWMVQWFCLVFWRLMYEHHTLGLWVSTTWCFISK